MNIFGSLRNRKTRSIDWSGLLSLLEDDDRRAAVQFEHPGQRRESFLAALRRIETESVASAAVDSSVEHSGSLTEKVLAAGRQYDTAEKLVEWPTVAVAGMLNSGKTSLVGTFLSESGRRRTLRGNSNQQGTHRFVLWLPSSWEEDQELWSLLLQRIGDAIGKPPEMLHHEPELAHQQYNNREGSAGLLSVPLIATDPQLDKFGVGLLDCPDIVSDEALGLGSPQDRRALLGRAATLCSAFLVVTSAESSRDAALGDLLRIASDLMPGIPRMLAVNKIRPRQPPDQVFETFDPLARTHGIDTIYAAYDFEIPASGPYIPGYQDLIANSSGMSGFEIEEETLPVFFSLKPNSDENPPAAIGKDRMLESLPTRLDRGVLFETFRYSLEGNLRRAVWEDGFTAIDRGADQSEKFTEQAQRCLLNTTLDFFAHREVGTEIAELRLHQSERIIRQLSESFALTAPWYARWGVRLNAKVRGVFGGAGSLLRNLTPTAMAERTAGEIKDKFRSGEYGGLMTPSRLIQSIDRHGGHGKLRHLPPIQTVASSDSDNITAGTGRIAEPWAEMADAAILRFERDDFTSLDPRRLDEAVSQMWSEVPRGRKILVGLTPLGAMLATFGGVLALPVDFGSTLIASASISELLIAGGLTTFATMWAGKQNTKSVEQQAARQQVADFHAVLCDTFGVARPAKPPTIRVGNNTVTLPEPKILLRDSNGQTLPLYHVLAEFTRQLSAAMPRNQPSRE